LDAIREILGAGTVSEQYAATLRQLLEQDREELRGRVDSRRGDRRPPRGDDRGSRGLAELLRDDRRSDALDERALKARSAAIRRALSDRNLRRDHAARLRAMQKADRRALARYLQSGREDRRRELRRRRDAGSLTIEILRNRRPAPRHSITAAEADEAALELQLVAPPTREIERQYSFEEYARRPEMREIMPGIEVDTIHFGFNEYFVGEEEIEQLDRIGEIMERIIAANPDEVFVVEGHTDAVGSDAYNLDLSGKRADAVKQALLDYFVIEPHNIETVGYGENYLKIVTPD